MPLPTQIPARYVDESAGYVNFNPVTKQTFQLPELIDMLVSVVGKDPARVLPVLQAGKVSYHGYRYEWEPITATPDEVAPLLVAFPDDDPSRAFQPAVATAVLFEFGGGAQSHLVEITRTNASRRKFYSRRNAWEVLLAAAAEHKLRYQSYSYAHKADLYRVALTYDQGARLLAAMIAVAPTFLRKAWRTLRPPTIVTFVCPRS
jgi:hypothetical protein